MPRGKRRDSFAELDADDVESRSSPPAPAVLISSDQFAQLMEMLRGQAVEQSMRSMSMVPTMPAAANFTKCTSRFDGASSSDVLAFIDAIEIYKECAGIDDEIAMKGLPMLFTDLAATWWQGVKSSTRSWSEAMRLLKQMYGPRLPPHTVYRKLFDREQGDECTDIYICKARALIAQLPQDTLSEEVQLDMIYGLLHRRIREKVSRLSFATFGELLQQARRVEDMFEEGRGLKPSETTQAVSSGSTEANTLKAVSAPTSEPAVKKFRPRCFYCKTYGHVKEGCPKLEKKMSEEHRVFSVSPTCFGCATRGYIRANCPKCREEKPSTSSSNAVTFSLASVSPAGPIRPRGRPVLYIDIHGEKGRVIIDTGAKQSIASDSLYKLLCRKRQRFTRVKLDLRFANGFIRKQNLLTTTVIVKVKEVSVPTVFIVIPGATDSLLGSDFVRDAGLVLNFSNDSWSLPGLSDFDLEYEDDGTPPVLISALSLREDKLTSLSPPTKEQCYNRLEDGKVFTPGGDITPSVLKECKDVKKRVVHKEVSFAQDDGVLVAFPVLSNVEGFSHKLGPRHKGPYLVRAPVSSATYEVEDRASQYLEECHASSLTSYAGNDRILARVQKRNRWAKPHTSRFCGLEGEYIARGAVCPHLSSPSTPRPVRARRFSTTYEL